VGSLPEFVVIGIVEKARGIRGEVKIKPLTDEPTRFERLTRVRLETKQGETQQVDMSAVNVVGNRIFATFAGVETREQAQALAGAYISIKQEDVLPLREGEFYHFELTGLLVKTKAGEDLGHIHEVLDLAANDVLVVRRQKKEVLIPFIKEVIVNVDIEKGEVIINPIQGLLD